VNLPDKDQIDEAIVLSNYTVGRVVSEADWSKAAGIAMDVAKALCESSMHADDAKTKRDIAAAQKRYDEAKAASDEANERLHEQVRKVNTAFARVNLGQNVVDLAAGGVGVYAVLALEGPVGLGVAAVAAGVGFLNDRLRPGPVSAESAARQVIDVANTGSDVAREAGQVIARESITRLGGIVSAFQSFHNALETAERISVGELQEFLGELKNLNPSGLQQFAGVSREELENLTKDAIKKEKAVEEAQKALDDAKNKQMNSGADMGTCIQQVRYEVLMGTHPGGPKVYHGRLR
jgi:hypothetical protein